MLFVEQKIPHTPLDGQAMCFNSYKNRELKVKVWWIGARERKKNAFFVTFILSEGSFFKVCVLSQCIVLNKLSVYTFTYQITLIHKLFCLFLK